MMKHIPRLTRRHVMQFIESPYTELSLNMVDQVSLPMLEDILRRAKFETLIIRSADHNSMKSIAALLKNSKSLTHIDIQSSYSMINLAKNLGLYLMISRCVISLIQIVTRTVEEPLYIGASFLISALLMMTLFKRYQASESKELKLIADKNSKAVNLLSQAINDQDVASALALSCKVHSVDGKNKESKTSPHASLNKLLEEHPRDGNLDKLSYFFRKLSKSSNPRLQKKIMQVNEFSDDAVARFYRTSSHYLEVSAIDSESMLNALFEIIDSNKLVGLEIKGITLPLYKMLIKYIRKNDFTLTHLNVSIEPSSKCYHACQILKLTCLYAILLFAFSFLIGVLFFALAYMGLPLLPEFMKLVNTWIDKINSKTLSEADMWMGHKFQETLMKESTQEPLIMVCLNLSSLITLIYIRGIKSLNNIMKTFHIFFVLPWFLAIFYTSAQYYFVDDKSILDNHAERLIERNQLLSSNLLDACVDQDFYKVEDLLQKGVSPMSIPNDNNRTIYEYVQALNDTYQDSEFKNILELILPEVYEENRPANHEDNIHVGTNTALAENATFFRKRNNSATMLESDTAELDSRMSP